MPVKPFAVGVYGDRAVADVPFECVLNSYEILTKKTIQHIDMVKNTREMP